MEVVQNGEKECKYIQGKILQFAIDKHKYQYEEKFGEYQALIQNVAIWPTLLIILTTF